MKAIKGTVSIGELRGRLRLYWSYDAKRYFLPLGLNNSRTNRARAELIAETIQQDIRLGTFDPTLNRYRGKEEKNLGVCAVFERYRLFKSPTLSRSAIRSYEALDKRLEEYFKDETPTVDSCCKFLSWTITFLEPSSYQAWVYMLKACYTWACETKLVTSNPWRQADKIIRYPNRKKIQPFTKEEVKLIVSEFQTNPKYKHYLDYIEFKLHTGCRSGEVGALQWKHLNNECTQVLICQTINCDGKIKPSTKTGQNRRFNLSPYVAQFLLNRKKNLGIQDLEEFVFQTPGKKLITSSNFSNHVWKPVLKKLGIPYRRPYVTRATMISHALDAQCSPVDVAAVAGHDPGTMFKHYAGLVKEITIPELW